MNLKEARVLTRQIDKTSGCRVTGTRKYGRGDYALDVLLTESGDRLVLSSARQWEERAKWARAFTK